MDNDLSSAWYLGLMGNKNVGGRVRVLMRSWSVFVRLFDGVSFTVLANPLSFSFTSNCLFTSTKNK